MDNEISVTLQNKIYLVQCTVDSLHNLVLGIATSKQSALKRLQSDQYFSQSSYIRPNQWLYTDSRVSRLYYITELETDKFLYV